MLMTTREGQESGSNFAYHRRNNLSIQSQSIDLQGMTRASQHKNHAASQKHLPTFDEVPSKDKDSTKISRLPRVGGHSFLSSVPKADKTVDDVVGQLRVEPVKVTNYVNMFTDLKKALDDLPQVKKEQNQR